MTAPAPAKHPRTVLAAFAAAWTLLWVTLGSLSDWGAFWVCWIIFGFAVPEAYGLIFNTADTFSRNIWAAEHINFGHPFHFADWSVLHWLLAITVWGLAVWLSGHLPFAVWRLSTGWCGIPGRMFDERTPRTGVRQHS